MSDQIKLDVNEAEFESVVVNSAKPVLVDFWAEWCGPCRMVGPIVESLAEDYADQIVVKKLNVDDSPEIAARYGVRGIPTLMLFKNGKAADTLVGAQPKATLERLLNSHID